MKKKFLSLFTAVLMMTSLLVVMPAASAGAEIASTSSGSGGSETVENIIYADFSVVTEEATTETDTSTGAWSSSGSSAKTTRRFAINFDNLEETGYAIEINKSDVAEMLENGDFNSLVVGAMGTYGQSFEMDAGITFVRGENGSAMGIGSSSTGGYSITHSKNDTDATTVDLTDEFKDITNDMLEEGDSWSYINISVGISNINDSDSDGINTSTSDYGYYGDRSIARNYEGDTYTQPTDGYTAYLMFADSSWMWANFGPNGYRSSDPDENGQYSSGGYGQDALVTGDGTYTVSIVAPEAGSAGGDEYITGKITDSTYPENIQTIWNTDSQELEAAVWATIFNVDIVNLIDGTEVLNDDGEYVANTYYTNDCVGGPYKASAITISDVKVAIDGTKIAVDQSKVKYGNLEGGNYDYRIEIYNEYGTTEDDPPINIEDIEAYESISVTFTISGLDSQNVDGIEPIPVTINTGKQKAPNELSVGIKSSTTNEAQTAEIAADGTVSLGNLPDGTYTLTFSAENCAPRSYTATVENGAIVEDIDVSLNLYGDVTGDGAANVKDMSKVYKNINKTELLSGYTKDVADITLDGKVNVKDYSKIYKHINKTALLW